jgi:branched-chain amino acid transport system ATP-binding protein
VSEQAPAKDILEIDDVHVYYGAIHALKGVSLRVGAGEIVTLIGANGAGKSTTLRAINGLNRPRHGAIRFQGQDITGAASHAIVKSGIAQSPEGRRLFPLMSVTENLEMGAFQRTDKENFSDDMDRVFELFPRLQERRTQKAGTLSGGEQQMCAIARGLMSRPKLLMIDELSLGLAPKLVDEILERLAQVRERGTALLVVEQDVDAALRIAGRGYVLETGRVVTTGESAALLEDPRVREAYLGVT